MPLAWLVIAIVAFGSFFGLLLLPIFPKHTADWLDVVVYTLDALVFQFAIKKPSQQTSLRHQSIPCNSSGRGFSKSIIFSALQATFRGFVHLLGSEKLQGRYSLLPGQHALLTKTIKQNKTMNTINIYKTLTSVLLVAFLLTSLTVMAQERRNLKGEGEPVSQNRTVSGFKGIDVSGGFAVEVTQSGKEGVRIEAQENLLSSIKTEVKNGVLHIYTSDNISTSKGLKAYVSIKELNMLDISGGVKVTSSSTFKTDAFKMDLSGGSSVTLALNTKKLTADMSGASKVMLTARADEVRMDLSGASKVDAAELEASNVYLEASGASNVKVYAKKELSVNASGATKVSYKGDPSVSSNVSAAAKISKM